MSEGKGPPRDPLEEQLQTLAEHLPFDVWVRDLEDRCVYANATALRHWPAALGRTTAESAPDEAARRLWQSNNARALAGEVVRGEVHYAFDYPDGTYYNLVAPLRSAAGKVTGTVGVNVDITLQRRAERALGERDAVLRHVFLTSPMPLGLREVRGDDILHREDNRAMAAVFGRVPDELRDRSERALGVPPALVESTIARFRQARTQGSPVPFELSFVTPDGPRTLVGRVAAVVDPAGAAELYVVAAEDVTEQRRLEAQLLYAERLASLGTMAASLGHEINNPAAYALVSLQYVQRELARGGAGTPEVREALRAAEAGVEQIARLVRELQRLARPESEALEPVDLNAVVASAMSLAGAAVRARARLVVQPGEVPRVQGSPVRLSQVVLNLVTNAAQALNGWPAGEIQVRTGTTAGGRVVLEVVDNGPGVSPAVRGRLFEPFSSSKAPEGNSGLGLYICKQLVEAMGGSIRLEDRAGGGTVAQVELQEARAA